MNSDQHRLSDTAPVDRTGFIPSRGFFAVLIPVACLLVYAKTVFYAFTFADDAFLIITNNDFFRDLRNIPRLFTQDVFVSIANPNVFYRPLLNLTFMLETQLAGTEPWLYHLSNVLLHACCALLLFRVLRFFTETDLAAGALALLFAVHPLLTSAVAWIPGRNDTLMTLFLLSSLYFFLRFLENRRAWLLLLHLVTFFFALLTKESSVVFPFLLAGYVAVTRRLRAERKPMLMMACGWALAGVLWYVMRESVERSFTVKTSLADALGGLLGNAPALLLYLGKALFPFNLSVFPNLADATLVWGIAAAAVTGTAFFFLKPGAAGVAAWGVGWFLLFLLPSLAFGEIFHEHRAYASLAGLALFASQLRFWSRMDARRLLLVTALLAAGAAVLSFLHADNFRDRRSYALDVYERSPGLDVAYSGMGGLLIDEHRYAEAEEVLLKGLAKNPDAKITHRMLADVYARKGDAAKASAEYERAIQIEPLNLTAYANYGRLCVQQGNFDRAADLWHRAIEIQPDYYLGYYLLANLYLHEWNDPDAAMGYVEALERRGVAVMPELVAQIQNHPKFRKKPPAP